MAEFGKWWKDLKKHQKRLHHWLPHWRELAARVGVERLRYFTLCARPMIDVFMLVRAGLLTLDRANHSIAALRFCECDQEHFAEIKDLVAVENAGFLGHLEEVVLFRDDDFTAQAPTLNSISIQLEDEGLTETQVNRLQLKRTHLDFRASFPYDLINLDFCEYYYPKPPDILRINRTLEAILEWQRIEAPADGSTKVDEFVMAVTCRHDADFPPEAEARLSALIKGNCREFDEYRALFERTRGADIDKWISENKEDFFLAGWPKDIARSARDLGWSVDILDYVFYRRIGDREENPYLIACLILKFARARAVPNYVPAALYALDRNERVLINEVSPASTEGVALLSDLTEIVDLRNEQARRMKRNELPDPGA